MGVLDGCGRVVDGARSADDEKTVILAVDDCNGLFAALDDCLECGGRGWDLGGEELGWYKGILTDDCKLVSILLAVEPEPGGGGFVLRVSSMISLKFMVGMW